MDETNKIRIKRIKKLIPDWNHNEQIFDLRLCPDCETLQLNKPMSDGSHCDNPECESEIVTYTRKGRHCGMLMWYNENWG